MCNGSRRCGSIGCPFILLLHLRKLQMLWPISCLTSLSSYFHAFPSPIPQPESLKMGDELHTSSCLTEAHMEPFQFLSSPTVSALQTLPCACFPTHRCLGCASSTRLRRATSFFVAASYSPSLIHSSLFTQSTAMDL